MEVYLVGGAVRDALMERDIVDRDWVVVGATPEEMKAAGFDAVGRDFPVFLHPETREEYALARTERKTGPGHTDFDCDSGPNVTIFEDLARRDLTINAIAIDRDGQVIDPYGGVRDVHQGVLRHVSDAFFEDPLRFFRVLRFAARFETFSVDPVTMQMLESMRADLAALPPERVWQETRKALAERGRARFFELLGSLGRTDWFDAELVAGAARTFAKADYETGELAIAALGFAASEPVVSAQFSRLRADNDSATAARAVAAQHEGLVDAKSSAALLDALTAIGAFRQGERWHRVLRVCEIRFECNLEPLRELIQTLNTIKVDVAPGPDYGRALRAARIEAVDAAGVL